ncbi:MAG TPA: septal ring lytic transglycosylase RlpA family protein [Dissulfurispiraceae bacterium]|nr:septal ring lytic transglycosylase RlpA family protein [Dissulfurispiraceae bacterium]
MRTSAGIFFKPAPVFLVVLALGVALLSACATSRQTVGVSSAPPPETRQPAVSPADRLSEYEEIKGDKISCVASWYGREFHGRPTASGETFNMFALTCAHKDYPLGTKLKVSNPSNGSQVDCIVNDRGPFIEGRDLDMSYAAAKRIGLIGPGVAPVDIEPVGRYTRYVKQVKYGRIEGSTLTIQIGSFRDESNARRLKQGLELHYQDVYIMRVNIGKENYHRVRIGKFKNSGEALKLADTLAKEGYSVMITKYEQQI